MSERIPVDVRVETTPVQGLLVMHLGVHHEDDGWFKENWHSQKFSSLGLAGFRPVQHNVTHVASRGITRGFMAEPWDRLVSLTSGQAMGAWVDLRQGKSFGQSYYHDLDRNIAVFVPRGVANAHQVLEDGTTMNYLLEHHWTTETRSRSSFVNLFDPEIAIPWPISRDRAIVARRDTLHPMLASVEAIPPRRPLIVGTETPLGRMLEREMSGATGVATDQLLSLDPIDLTSHNALINASISIPQRGSRVHPGNSGNWQDTADRTNLVANVARQHRLRYVHVSPACVYSYRAHEYSERDVLDLGHPHGQSLAAGEVVASGVPEHLIVRTGWMIDQDAEFIGELPMKARRGEVIQVTSGQLGQLTVSSQLALAIDHLLDGGAEPGVYNIAGEGRTVSFADVARRLYQVHGTDPSNVVETSATSAELFPSVNSDKIRATGYRPQDSWVALANILDNLEPADPKEGGEESVRRLYKVLFVCTANICRSAYADVVARAHQVEGVEFGSAGTQALEGKRMDPTMATHVSGDGDVESHRARQLTRGILEDADLVIAMASDHRRYILDGWPALGRKTFVIGHVARLMGDLPQNLTMTDLVDYLWRHRTTRPSDDVPDPYARGELAAEQAANMIDRHLSGIFAGLHVLTPKPA